MNCISETASCDYIHDTVLEQNPEIMLICGATGSGKSTLSHTLAQRLKLPTLSLDSYFKDENEMELVLPEYNIRQWDSPDCYKWDTLRSDLKKIFRDKFARVPVFSHEKSTQNGWRNLSLTNTPLIVEGLYSMNSVVLDTVKDLRLKALSVFLDISEEERWNRKYKRDVLERNENPETLRIWFDQVIKPAEKKWINPQKIIADLLVSSD